jgi:hypothetical protein
MGRACIVNGAKRNAYIGGKARRRETTRRTKMWVGE